VRETGGRRGSRSGAEQPSDKKDRPGRRRTGGIEWGVVRVNDKVTEGGGEYPFMMNNRDSGSTPFERNRRFAIRSIAGPLLIAFVLGSGFFSGTGWSWRSGSDQLEDSWSGWSVKQDLQERRVEVGLDGTTVTDIRERWTCLRPDRKEIRDARLVYSPIRELTVFEKIEILVNKQDALKTFKPGTQPPRARIKDVPNQGKIITLVNLQPRDMVEVRLKLRQQPLIPGHFFSTIVLARPYPLERSIYQVVVPGNSPFFYKQTSGIPPPEITARKNSRTFRWAIETYTRRRDALGGQNNETDPPRIVVSSTDRWEVIQTWFANHYFTPNPSIFSVAPERLPTFRGEVNDSPPIIAFINSVADQIQPTANKNRLGGLVPSSPFEVWEKKKGDCKDVVALLCFLFQGSKVRARPVLVSPLNLNQELPNPHIFTHAILKMETPEGEFFFDPQSKIIRDGIERNAHDLDLPLLPIGGRMDWRNP
jgi:hypothetical protein